MAMPMPMKDKTLTLPEGWQGLYPPRSDIVHIGRERSREHRTLCGREYNGSTWGAEGIPHYPRPIGHFCPRCYARWIGKEVPKRFYLKQDSSLEEVWSAHGVGDDFLYVQWQGLAREILSVERVHKVMGPYNLALRIMWDVRDPAALTTRETLLAYSPQLRVWHQNAPFSPAGMTAQPEIEP